MPSVAILSKPLKPELYSILTELAAWMRAHDFEPVFDEVSGSYTDVARVVPREAMGSLGFLTEVRLSDLYTTLEAWCAECFVLDERSMLHTELWRDGALVTEHDALNDIVVSKGAIARMGQFTVKVDDRLAASYRADGVILSTPTGSTAYSLSANGPILDPNVDALIITPVCPHLLTMRPLVVRGDAHLSLSITGTADQNFLTVDGQEAIPMLAGDELRCRKSDHRVKLIRVGHGSFFDVLRTKLKWGER
jgi:NAD+ kinase